MFEVDNKTLRRLTDKLRCKFILLLIYPAPNGLHVVIVEMKKMLKLFRVGDLKTEIGQYSMYGEVSAALSVLLYRCVTEIFFTHDLSNITVTK